MDGFMGFGPHELILLLGIGAFVGITVVLPYWKIFSKAGFTG